MYQTEVESFVTALENVQRTEAYGYIFFFVGDDHRMPFVTLASSDQEFDNISNLSRDGVFRINIGISKQSFQKLFASAPAEEVDHTALNAFMPHPEYAKQNFICILNPSGENEATTKALIREAHDIATARFQRTRGI